MDPKQALGQGTDKTATDGRRYPVPWKVKTVGRYTKKLPRLRIIIVLTFV